MSMHRRLFLKATLGGLYLPKLLQQPGFDLILRRGSVIDGSGAPARVADVGITGSRITAIGALSGVSAARSIDVSSLTVAPGFIDVHTHSEDELVSNPKAESKIRQGVTTEIMGMGRGVVQAGRFRRQAHGARAWRDCRQRRARSSARGHSAGW